MKTQKQTTHRHLCCLLFAAATWLASTLHATPLAYSGGTATAELSAGQWAYYEVTVPPGNAGWRLTLNATGPGNPDLYLQRGVANVPTTNSYLIASTGEATDTITLTDTGATPTNYVVGVYLPSGGPVNFILTSEDHYLTPLTWDPGTADSGTATFTNTSPTGGEYFLKLVTENANLGMWRTALRVTSGEANLYLRQDALPTTALYQYKSDRLGSDGVVRPLSSGSGAGQTWYLMVKATAGAQWSLLSGDIFVTDLGTLATNAASGSGLSAIPPEGLRYFKTTIPSETLAWRLWLQSAAGDATWNTHFYVRKSLAPHPESAAYYDQNRIGQALLVPGYLVAGGGDPYYVAVPGNPGDTFQLDSRQQAVTDIAFNTTLLNTSLASLNVTANDFSYVTYRVQVPVEQIAWQINLFPSSGAPDLAVRRDLVPNESNNDALSTAGGTTGESITLVPAPNYGSGGLSDGTFYITVYGSETYTNASLFNGNPVITPEPYVFTATNDAPGRVGWRYYQVTEQFIALGWELLLSNAPPGTEIALRRNAVPGRWNYLQNNYGSLGTTAFVDASSTAGFLQDPGHQSDVWYIGIYSPNQALGDFVLRSQPIASTPVAFDRGSLGVTNAPIGFWRYFRVEVPTNALGWDLRLANVTAGNPQMYVRKDTLPTQQSLAWYGGTDWTGYNYRADGSYANMQMIAGTVAPGTYYVGVRDAYYVSSYTLISRGIGTNGFSIPVTDLGTNLNFTVSGSNLLAREAAYYKVTVPSNTPCWKLRLAPTAGETMLVLRKDELPSTWYSFYYGYPDAAKLQKAGPEHWLILPGSSQTNLQAGTYYLAAVSEGANPNYAQSRIGSGSADFVLSSQSNLPVLAPTNSAGLNVVGVEDLVLDGALEGGEVADYAFIVPPGTLSLEVRLENRVGNPWLAVAAGGGTVTPNWFSYHYYNGGYYTGSYGGLSPWQSEASLITLANPGAGAYRVSVCAATLNPPYPYSAIAYYDTPNASYRLRVHAVTAPPVAFDGGTISVTNVPVGEWRYFRVEVPTNALGWDLRLANVTLGTPYMYVRKDMLPTEPWQGHDWAGGTDWTGGYRYHPDGSNAYEQTIAGTFTPGTYYIGVLDAYYVSSYTLISRGIGTNGFSIPVTDLGTNLNFTVSSSNLLAREAAYYKVTVSSNTPSWKLRLAPTAGETMLVLRKDELPSTWYSYYGYPDAAKLQKAGPEHWLILPDSNQTNLQAGTYYLAAVSEGANPNYSQGRIGSGSADFVLSSQSPLPVLSPTNSAGLNVVGVEDLVLDGVLEGGEVADYAFIVPPGTLSLEVRLENRVGNPWLAVAGASGTVTPNWRSDHYNGGYYTGSYGGLSPWQSAASLITLANPGAGAYRVSVCAATLNPPNYPYSIAYSDTANASYRLRVRAVPPPDLNFTSQLNLNGHTNVVSGILADNQRAFFRVAVPATVDGAPVLGWKLDLNQTNGSPSVRVRRDVLPWDGDTASTPFSTGSAIIAPPYLTPGTWFVEVKGSGSTDFTLLSSAITTNTLQRPLWTMPSLTERTDTPGLARPEFGDTGTADDGTPLSGDRGVDLEQGQFHFYAIIVPTNNAGLLRTELVAISGNPDLYLRVGVTPTLTHYSTGGGGFTLYDRWLTGTGTEYGNWVPLDGRAQTNLTPGLWVLGVRATGYSNARYRLRLGCGNPAAGSRVQPVDLASGFSGAGTLSGGDWRYYCVSAPTNGLVPASWTFTFARSIGNARVFVRDTVAPGDPETKRDYGYYTQYHYERDWYSDNKNQGPYPHFDVPGTYTLDTPPLRPGAVYWLGVWSPDDSAFTLTFATNGPVDNVANSVAFYGGSVTNLLPPNSVTMYRMDVPPDATRLKLYGTNTASVGLSLEQGTLAQTGGGAHWRSSGANPSLDQSLTQPYWPWRPGFTYYLAVNNTAGTAQAFSLFADGRNAATEDNDNDGLPDAWEILYFGNTSYTGTSDPDGDGNNNLMEFADGTKPNNANSAKYLLTVNVSGPGTVGRTPALPKYDKGTNVILTATADAGNRFVGWTGFINATSASVAIMVVTNCTVTAIFVPVTVSVEAFVVGGLKREVYTNIPGVLLSGLTNNAKFLGNAPDLVDPLWQFESTPNWGDNYGARLSGWLLPPTNGNYRFYLASDDQGALFLSPDATPANKVLIATEPEWNGYREYVTGANQASRGSPAVNISTNIPLIAGRAYYVEALLKESVGGDYLSVAWQPPGGPALANGDPPIYGRYLASGTPLTGPLLLLSAASLTNSSRITVRFERPVEGGTATQPTNYLVAGATVISASLAPDSRLVVLGVSGLTGATFDLRVRNVADAFGNPLSPNSAIVGQVLPQQSQDIGTASNPLEPGVPLPCAVGEFVVVAGGSDIWGTADHGHFVYEQRTGDFDVQVRVEALEPVSANTKAGLMVRETLAAGSREILAAINPTGPTRDGKNGGLGSDAYDFAIRATTAGSTTDWFLPSVDVNAPSYPNAWVRLKRQGSTFSGYRSSDGNTWTLIGQTTQSLPATVYVGPATTANNNSPGFTALARYHSYGTLGFNPPVITAPPADLTVSVGASAALAVTATGAAPLAYQWRYNGTNIAGATNATLALQNLQASNAGDYRVVVSNAAGLVNSLPARLTVLEPLVLSARLNLGTGSLSLGFNGPPGQRYQIELSLDLKVWLPVLNITNTTSSSHVELPLPGGPMGFYRAVLLP